LVILGVILAITLKSHRRRLPPASLQSAVNEDKKVLKERIKNELLRHSIQYHHNKMDMVLDDKMVKKTNDGEL